MNLQSKGKVYLIGAGPGDVELLTIKGMRRLQECDVILIDDLANADILQFKKSAARVIEVGKRGGSMQTSQIEIVDQMIAFAQEGLIVGRLKGGDPFIFGRGGEEITALKEAHVECEVISGITSGIAVPAAIGIPLTHRRYASGVTMITGHNCSDENLNWQAIANSKTTLVIYMGMTQIVEISTTLRGHGMSSQTPVAIVENGTLSNQRSVLTNLGNLANAVASHKLGSPAIIVIGDVVSMADLTSEIETPEIDSDDARLLAEGQTRKLVPAAKVPGVPNLGWMQK